MLETIVGNATHPSVDTVKPAASQMPLQVAVTAQRGIRAAGAVPLVSSEAERALGSARRRSLQPASSALVRAAPRGRLDSVEDRFELVHRRFEHVSKIIRHGAVAVEVLGMSLYDSFPE